MTEQEVGNMKNKMNMFSVKVFLERYDGKPVSDSEAEEVMMDILEKLDNDKYCTTASIKDETAGYDSDRKSENGTKAHKREV